MSLRLLQILAFWFAVLLSGCPDLVEPNDDDDSTPGDDDDSTPGDDDDSTPGDDDDSAGDDDDSAGDDDDSAGDDDDAAGDDDDASVSCVLAGSMSCPGTPTISANNSDLSNISTYDSWGCFPDPLTGPEVIYEYIPSTTGIATFTLSGLSADLDLIVLAGSCEPASCVTSSNVGGLTDEVVVLSVTAGQPYYLVVDGWAGAVSDFDLEVDCGVLGDDDDSAAGDDDDSSGFGDVVCVANDLVSCTLSSSVLGDTLGPIASDQVDTYGCDPMLDETGPEVVYSYTAVEDTEVTLTLTDLNDDLDLFLLLESSTGDCDPDNCIAHSATHGDETISFTAIAGLTYFVAVDGHLGATSSFRLEVDCPTCSDSAALDCIGTPADTWNNGIGGSTDQISEYACDTALNESGPEYVYEFVAPVAGSYTFQLTGLSANLDLFVLDDASGCDPADCIDHSANPGAIPETVSVIAANPGDVAYLVVDGESGAISDYTLTAFCPSGLVGPNATSLNCITATAIDDSTSGSTEVDDWCGFGTGQTTGPELIYSFQPPATGDYVVDLSFGAGDLFLAVLEEAGVPGVADSTNCLDWSDSPGLASGEQLNFSAAGGETYYLAVDGNPGHSALFTLDISCPTCANSAVLGCGATDSWNNSAAGSTDIFDNYTGCPGYISDGPEYVYVYTPTTTGSTTIDLTGLAGDLDLYVTEADPTGTCDPSLCIASSILSGHADESLTFASVGGTTYYISVDGFGGATSSYNVSLTCN